MEMSLAGMVELMGLEGICLSPYYDSVGVVTIGVGATRSEIPGLSMSHPSITMKEAIDLFKKSIIKYTDPLNRALKVRVTQQQFDALASITYNIGVGGMQKSTFMKRVNKGAHPGYILYHNWGQQPISFGTMTNHEVEYKENESVTDNLMVRDDVASAILMWDKPPEIRGRRLKEARLYQTGVYSNNGKALLFPVDKNGYPVYSKGKEIDVYALLYS